MDKLKNAILNNRCGSLSIAITMILVSLYVIIPTFSVIGLLGFVVLNLLVFYFFERLIHKNFGFFIDVRFGAILFAVGLIACVLSTVNCKLIDNPLSLSIIAILTVVIISVAVLSKVKNKMTRIFVLFLSFGLVSLALGCVYMCDRFSPDSIVYYDVALSTLKDYGNISLIRQYIVDSVYNCSFPYLYPFLIFVVDLMTGLGIYSGVLVNIYACLLSVFVLLKFSKMITSEYYSGIIASVVLLTSPNYLDEISCARAIPVSILVILSSLFLFYSVFRSSEKKYSVILLGLVVGLAPVTRFDNLPFVAFGLLILIIMKENRVKNALMYISGVLISVSPWIIYSLVRFRKPWITDNSGTAFKVKPGMLNAISLPNDAQETLFTDPGLWFKVLLTEKSVSLSLVIICSFVGLMCFVFGCFWLYASRNSKTVSLYESRYFITVLIFYILKTGMYIVVGYPDVRYHVETVVVMSFAFVAFCSKYKKITSYKPLLIGLIPCIVLTLSMPIAFHPNLYFPPRITELRADISDNGFGAIFDAGFIRKANVPDEQFVTLNNTLEEMLEEGEAVVIVEYASEVELLADYKIFAYPIPENEEELVYLSQLKPEIRYIVIGDYIDHPEYFTSRYHGRMVGDFYVIDIRDSK